MDVKRRTAQSLISKLQSKSGPDSTRSTALCELRHLANNDPDIRPVIAGEGAIPHLAEALASVSPINQENASAILFSLSVSCPEALMSTVRLLNAVSDALIHHPAALQFSIATVRNLLRTESYCLNIGSNRDIVKAVIEIVGTSDCPATSLKHALKALLGLALYPSNRSTMVELGAAEALFGLVENERRAWVVKYGTGVVARMAGCIQSPAAFRRVSGIRILVDLLDPGMGWNSRIRKNAVSGLLNLVHFGRTVVVDEIRDFGVLFVFNGLKEMARNGSQKAQKLMDILDGISLDGLDISSVSSIDSGSGSGSGSDSNSDSP